MKGLSSLKSTRRARERKHYIGSIDQALITGRSRRNAHSVSHMKPSGQPVNVDCCIVHGKIKTPLKKSPSVSFGVKNSISSEKYKPCLIFREIW